MPSVQCTVCGSDQLLDFSGEICLHFNAGLKGLQTPALIMFARVEVCAQCGAASFRVPESELPKLHQYRIEEPSDFK